MTSVLMLTGAVLMLIAGLGVIRLPDLYMRVSASTKASTLGAGFCLLALAVHFNEFGITMRSIATIVFLVITAPVAAHLISRAAYLVGVSLWEDTITDELKGRYNRETKTLESIHFDEAGYEQDDVDHGNRGDQ